MITIIHQYFLCYAKILNYLIISFEENTDFFNILFNEQNYFFIYIKISYFILDFYNYYMIYYNQGRIFLVKR